MTPESPSATIRRAAKLMRDRAKAIPGVFPWRAEGRNVTTTQDYDGFDPDWDMGFTVATCMRQDEAEHIASWHPLVAAAVAELLEHRAAEYDQLADDCGITGAWFVAGEDGGDVDPVIKLARRYLGETEPSP